MVCGVPAVKAETLQPILQTYATEIAKPSRKTVGETIDTIAASGLPQVTAFLEQWSEKTFGSAPMAPFCCHSSGR